MLLNKVQLIFCCHDIRIISYCRRLAPYGASCDSSIGLFDNRHYYKNVRGANKRGNGGERSGIAGFNRMIGYIVLD
jgi:hypothetical protein